MIVRHDLITKGVRIMKNKIYIMLCVVFLFQFLTGCQKNPVIDHPTQTTQVATEYQTEEKVVQTTESITTEIQSAKIMLKVYLGDLNKEELVYTEQEFTINEDEKIEDYFTKMLKEKYSDTEMLVKAIPNDATIQKVEIIEDKAYVDMSEEYPYMNYGGGGEWLALQSLANTIGNYYGIKEVVVTVNGEPYSSGHILFESGEGIKVIEEAEKLE